MVSSNSYGFYEESIGWLDSPSVLHDTVERVAQVKALGLDVGVDFHGRVHKAMAKQLVKLLESHQPLFIEGRSINPKIILFRQLITPRRF